MKCEYCGLDTESPLGHLYLCIRKAAKERMVLVDALQSLLKLIAFAEDALREEDYSQIANDLYYERVNAEAVLRLAGALE